MNEPFVYLYFSFLLCFYSERTVWMSLHVDVASCRVFGPYSMDVVTSTAFSVDVDSINHPSDPFVANIKKMVKFSFLNPLLVLIGILYIIY